MIVRILTEGQYRVAGACLDELNLLDNELVRLVAAGDEANFLRVFAQMLNLVRQKGEPLPIDELQESELILPSPDLTLSDAKKLFVSEGLIPG